MADLNPMQRWAGMSLQNQYQAFVNAPGGYDQKLASIAANYGPAAADQAHGS